MHEPGDLRQASVREVYRGAVSAHFEWQTRGAFVAERERDLVRSAFLPLGARVLDLGCGEGATLYHLGEPEGAVGVDLLEEKVAFARERLPRCRFVAASALDLPFPPASFDHVLVRDVIHHLPAPRLLLDEVRRVLAPGGRVDVLEPCRYNPFIAAHALAVPEERGELRSTARYLASLLAPSFEVTATTRHQAFPLHRIVFHPALGRPALAERPLARGLVAGFERAAERLLPRGLWAYVHLRAILR